MKTVARIFTLLLIACGAALAAQQELTGVWQGKLQVDPKTAMTIQFTFAKKPDGSYTAVLDSPDNPGIKNVAANAVSFSDGTLKVAVTALSGSYAGTLKGSSFDGQWTQPGGALPLVLTPYQKPQLSKAAIKTLTGAWNGPLELPGGKLTFVMRFKVDAKGELQGALAVPEQGGQEIPMADIEFADNKLSFKVPQVRGEFTATFANDTFNGSWKQGGQPPNGLAAVLKRGDVGTPVYPLKLSNEAFVQLSGSWQGTLEPKTPDGKPVTGPDGKAVTVPVVLRFESNSQAQYVASLDMGTPPQGAKGIPVSDASLTGGKLVVKVDALRVEFDADLSMKTLSGQWMAGPGKVPLTLTRK